MRMGSVAIIAELVGRCFTLCICFFQKNVYCLMSTFVMSLLSKNRQKGIPRSIFEILFPRQQTITQILMEARTQPSLSSDLHHDWSLCFMHSDVVSGVILLHLVLPFPNCPFLYTYLHNVLHIFSIKVKWFWQKKKKKNLMIDWVESYI